MSRPGSIKLWQQTGEVLDELAPGSPEAIEIYWNLENEMDRKVTMSLRQAQRILHQTRSIRHEAWRKGYYADWVKTKKGRSRPEPK